MPRLTLMILAFVLAGCYQGPDWYAPPVQRQPLSNSALPALGMFVQMNHPNAPAYLLKDVSESVEGNTWRWTYRRPEFRFYLDKTENLKVAVDLTIAGATFEKTGPVTVSFFVNDRFLDKQLYTTAGRREYVKPVPPEFLKPFSVNRIALKPDKVWVSPEDGAALGLILTEAGFKR